jgi:hypothetical protein
MKRIEMDIRCCGQCLYYRYDGDGDFLDCQHDKAVEPLWHWKGRPTESYPDWCPLPDKKGNRTMDTKTIAMLHMQGMIDADPELYERCLDTPGFAFHFNQIGRMACGMSSQGMEPAITSEEQIKTTKDGMILVDTREGKKND